jgi:hypothetical protein
MLRINYLSDTGTLYITVPVGNNVNNGKSSSHHVNIPHSTFFQFSRSELLVIACESGFSTKCTFGSKKFQVESSRPFPY